MRQNKCVPGRLASRAMQGHAPWEISKIRLSENALCAF